MIEFKNVSKIYHDGTKALKDFSLQIRQGELVALIGPSGCGKTTTMKMINRLIDPSSGAIYINDKHIYEYNIHELRWNIGYVLQEIALFPHLTIEENISVVPEMKKWKRKRIKERSAELLQMVGLNPDTYLRKMPEALSGGEQQRVGVIRALAANPDILLMDEPFSALDPITREQLQQDIRSLQKEIQKTIVFVTHDMDEAMALGDKVCLMSKGKIIQFDTPQQLILNPATDFVKDFIGERKSPWQTAIDVIANRSSDKLVYEQEFVTKSNQKGTFIIINEEGNYQGTVINGERKEIEVLRNDMPLFKAVDKLEKSEQCIFPVVKKNQVIGTLTYKDIVTYLKRNTKVENGVVK